MNSKTLQEYELNIPQYKKDSSFYLHLINPSSIKKPKLNSKKTAEDSEYKFTDVSPKTINNGDIVTVSFQANEPSDQDWIAVYSPADADITSTAPLKFGLCSTSPDYLTTGIGSLHFNMTNTRSDLKFYYFTGDLLLPTVVSESETVTFENFNQPLKNRLLPIGDGHDFALYWSSYNSTKPTLYWGSESGNYQHIVEATTSTLQKESLCGAPANSIGWYDLGLIHQANLTDLSNFAHSSTVEGAKIYYKFGDADTNDFSEEKVYLVPPAAGISRDRPTKIALFGDLGVGSSDNSFDTIVWEEACPPAMNTSLSIGNLVSKNEIDLVFHTGDNAYANGYLSSWDFFLDMISPITGGVPYLTTVGNHESDWIGSASIPYANTSGGECGILTSTLIPLPSPATTDKPWWSYDVGLVHVIGLSSEHYYNVGSEQYDWFVNDLKNVNRTTTPWILLSLHRSMYVASDYCCKWDQTTCDTCYLGTDVYTMEDLQKELEPLFLEYKINIAFGGHFHTMQRHSAVYQGKVVQRSVEKNIDGVVYNYHDNPQSTVWMLVGSGGRGPNYSVDGYEWCEEYWNDLYGYAILTAENRTHLSWELIDSSTNEVMDRMIITRTDDSSPWPVPNSNDSNSNGNSNDIAIGLGVTFSILGAILLFYLTKYVILPKFRKNEDILLSNQSTSDSVINTSL